MTFYWTLRSLPELGHLSERDRHHLLRISSAPRIYAGIAARSLIVALFNGGVCAAIIMNGSSDLSGAILSCAIAAVTFVAVYQWCMRIIRANLRLSIVEGYRGQRLPVCLTCGYNLAGNHGDECPECGSGILVKPLNSRVPASGEAEDDATVD